MAEEIHDDTPSKSPSLWSENHGNLLVTVMLGVFVVSAIVLFYRQHRLRKPRFPDSSAIKQQVDAGQTDQLILGEDSADADISIVVIGAANSKGSVRIALYGSVQSFNDPDKAVRRESLPIMDGVATWRIPRNQLPKLFALATFHDENDDGELNRNRIGVPTERYGFSRDARGLTGPPSFQQAAVDRSRILNLLEISIR